MIPKMKDPGIAPLALTMHGKTVLLSPACLTMSCTCLTMSCEEMFLFYCSKGIDVVCHRAKRLIRHQHISISEPSFAGFFEELWTCHLRVRRVEDVSTPKSNCDPCEVLVQTVGCIETLKNLAGLDGNMPKIAHAIIGPINDALVIPRGMRVIPRTKRSGDC